MKTFQLSIAIAAFVFAFGSISAQQLDIEGKIRIGEDATLPDEGMIRYAAGKFEGYNGAFWIPLDNLTVLVDADGDTRVLVEQFPDDDRLRISVDGQEALVLGKNAYQSIMLELQNPNGNLFIGQEAGLENQPDTGALEGINNTFLGYQAGKANTTGDDNTFIGNRAGGSNTTGEDNTFIGKTSGVNNSTGSRNTFLGHKAGFENTTGQSNIYIGDHAGFNNNIGHSNIVVGRNALYSDTTSRSIAIGDSALLLQPSGSNIAIGHRAARENIGTENTFLGHYAGERMNSAFNNKNVGIGFSALSDGLFSVANTVAIGYYAGGLIGAASGSEGVAIGALCGLGDQSVSIGYHANRDGANRSVVIGHKAGINASSDGQMMIGYAAGTNIGSSPGLINDARNTVIGYLAGTNLLSVRDNTFVGYLAGKGDGTLINNAEKNVVFGSFAAENITSAEENICIGYAAGQNIGDGINNTLIGTNSGMNLSSSTPSNFSNNTFVGHSSGLNVTSGTSNTYIGTGAGWGFLAGATGSVGDQNTLIGYNSGLLIDEGSNNVALGNLAGRSITDGNNNVYIGTQAGEDNTGTGNIFIGYQAGDGRTNVNNKLIIDNSDTDESLIHGDFFTDQLFINRDVDINISEVFGVRRNVTGPGQYGGMYMETNGNADSRPYYGFAIDGQSKGWIEYDGGENELILQNSSSSFTFESNGDISIPGDNASKATAGSWIANSDARLKKDISYLDSEEMLAKVLQMKGANYLWNDDKTGHQRPSTMQVGFIAQDLQKIWPEKVSEDAQGYLQTAYGDYDPVFVEAIKALYQKIEALEAEIEVLKSDRE